MSEPHRERPRRALLAAAFLATFALGAARLPGPDADQGLRAAVLQPVDASGSTASPQEATTPGAQRARMIALLESIDKRLASIQTTLARSEGKEKKEGTQK